MTNTKDEGVMNVNDLSPEQKDVLARRDEIMAILNKEPKMVLYPYMKYYPNGGMEPDVKLAIVKKETDEQSNGVESGTGDEAVGPADEGDSPAEPTGEQPSQA